MRYPDDPGSTMLRTRLLALVAVCMIAAAVWATAREQHRALDVAKAAGRNQVAVAPGPPRVGAGGATVADAAAGPVAEPR